MITKARTLPKMDSGIFNNIEINGAHIYTHVSHTPIQLIIMRKIDDDSL